MDTQKITTEYRLSQWAQVIQKKLDSGQSIKDFCQTMGINRNTYFYWQQKLRKTACTQLAKPQESKNAVPSGWMQISPQQTQQHMNTMLNIEISGCHITLNDGTDPELLMKVCRMLRSL